MKQKLLFVNASLQIGGVEKSLCDILRNIDPQKYDVYLYLDEAGAFFPEIEDLITRVEPNMEGCYGRFMPVAKSLITSRNYGALLLRFTRSMKGKIEIVMSHLLRKIYQRSYGSFDCVIAFREGFYSSFALKCFSARKYICWWHGSNPPDRNELSKYEDTYRFKHIVAVSHSTAEMIKNYLPNIDGVVTIPNMINNKDISQKARVSPYIGNIFRIVSVGRLAPEKHFENIVPAAKALLEVDYDFIWHIVGEGPERAKLEQLIAENNLENCIILEGGKTNPYPYMKYADLFVHPSYVESQGLTVLEAMALGVPCVVTKSLGPCEFIEDGVNGLLTEQSPESLTEKVLEILNDKALYQRIKENTKCPEQFMPDTVMKQIENLFDG